MTCNNGLCCHYPRSVCVRTAPGNVNMVAYGKINSRLSPVLIVQLSAAVTAGHRKAESFLTAFQRTPTGKVTSRITLFNINLDRVSLAAVACTNNSRHQADTLQTCACGSGSTGGSHCHGTGLKKHIVSYQMSPKVSLLGYRKRLETLCCQIIIMSIILSMWILFST